MNRVNPADSTLFSLIGRQWHLGAGVAGMAVNTNESAVAFALNDGAIALVPAADPEPPDTRIRISVENGRSTIHPRQADVEPPRETGPLATGPVPISPFRRSDFLTGDADGRLYVITAQAASTPLDLALDGPVVAIDHHAGTARTVCASATTVQVLSDIYAGAQIPVDPSTPVVAIAFSPDGSDLAVAHGNRLSIWHLAETPTCRRTFDLSAPARAVSWNPEGAWIACPVQDAGLYLLRLADEGSVRLTDYPAPVRTIAWNRNARALATSGAFRIAAWSLETPPFDDPGTGVLPTGRPGLVPLEAVATHPDRALVAAGYANGQVSIAQIGKPDELMLFPDGHGSVTSLIWTESGRYIAFGTDDGTIAVADLPSALFK